MAKGDFSALKMAEIQLKAEEMWKQPQYQKVYTAQGETIKAIKENQTARISDLEDPEKLKDVAVKWFDWCDDTARDTSNADQCPIDGPCDEAEGFSKTYALDIFIEDCLTVTEEDFETTVYDMDEVVALGMLKKEKNILERFNQKAIAKLAAFAGDNAWLGDIGTNNDGVTEVERKNWKIETLFPYLMQVMAMMRMNSTYIIDGSSLFQEAIRAMTTYANSDGKQAKTLWDMFRYYQDLFGFGRAGISENLFLIEPGAVAVATRSKYNRVPKEYGHLTGQTRWSKPMAQLPGVSLDIAYTNMCNADTIKHVWNMKLRGGIFLNPIRCEEAGKQNSGVLQFRRIADKPIAE